MSLGDALSIAMAGLRANQATLSLVSSNVANAETPGYVRKSIAQVTTITSSVGNGVQTLGINRELDQYIQAQLRTETSGAAYSDLRAEFLTQLQSIYGNPDSAGTLEDAYNQLTSALQALTTSPDSPSARIGVLNAAKGMAQQLNAMTQGVQSLRNAAENGIADSVRNANDLLRQIASINNQLQANPLGGTSTDSATAALLDQRDLYLGQLSQLMDIRVVTNGANQVNVFTSGGVQLVGNEAATLSFNAQGTVGPNTTWNSNPALSSLGSITVSYANGGAIDLTLPTGIKSGQIAAYVELRDRTLVQAQSQLDQLAAGLASALSDKTVAGTATTSGAQSGFNVDLAGMKAGNVIHLTYTDLTSGTQRQLSIMRVDDPGVLPLSDTATNDPNDRVVGVDFSGGMASVVAQLNAALGPANLQFSGTAPASLTVLNTPGSSTIDAVSATVTETSLTAGGPQLALFTDNGGAYSGAITRNGAQMTGFAGRISVNNALIADPSRLVVYSTSPATAAGDTTRPDFILNQIASAKFFYSAQTGVGSAAAPFKGTLLSYLQQFTSQQGAAASAASQLSEGQSVVLKTLQQKMTASSGVNIDDEMAHLLALQNAYAANARVMSTISDMLRILTEAM